MTRAVLSLGSNLGDRVAYLREAVAGLGDAALVVSGVYESPHWYLYDSYRPHGRPPAAAPPPGGAAEAGTAPLPGGAAGAGGASLPGADAEAAPPHLNAAVLVADAGVDPYGWLARARKLERAAGRVRDPRWRFAPRTLDVDVIMVTDDADQPVIMSDPELTLPHPRAHLRAFVLRPWIDIQPYAELPGHGRLTDLLCSDALAAGVAQLRARPDLRIESSE